jgi:hypothetical protein
MNQTVVILLHSEECPTPIVLAPTRGSFRYGHMAAKKKTNTGASEANTSTKAPPLTNDALVTTNNDNKNEDQGEDFEVENLTDGDFEVNLHDLGVSAKDIQDKKRIDARLSERLRHAQQAQDGTSNALVATRAKGRSSLRKSSRSNLTS